MGNKIRIEKNTVSETLVLPLNARAHCSRKYPDVFPDKAAEELIEKVEYDFASLNYKEFVMITWAFRNKMLIERAANYLKDHPRATIVNLGCGVDMSFQAIDNGRCKFINLDLPEVIKDREELIAPAEREKNVAADAFDLSWISEIETPIEDGVYIISGGVLMFFEEEKVRQLLTGLAEKLPGGGISFDGESSSAVKRSNKIVEKTGNEEARVRFAVNDVQETFGNWSEKFAQINCFDKLPDEIAKAKSIPFGARKMLKMGCNMGMIKIVEIIFGV